MGYKKKKEKNDFNSIKEFLEQVKPAKRRNRRSSEKVKLDKQACINEKLKHKWKENQELDEHYKQQMTKKMFDFRDKTRIWGFDANIFISKYMEAWEHNDINTMYEVLYKVEQDFETLVLEQNKQSIIDFIGYEDQEVYDILNHIKNPEEADRVLEALYGTDHITILDKGYASSKKNKQNKRTRKNKHIKYLTYEQALRRNRHMLENYLKETGTGQHRAQKISQILAYL